MAHLGTEADHLEGYVCHARFAWIQEWFPIVPDEGGNLVIRVTDYADQTRTGCMPSAVAPVDMAELSDPVEAARGLILIDDMLREFSGARRRWLTASEIAERLREELAADDELFALRFLAKSLSESRPLTEPADIARFLLEPATTGSRRWDSLLAAAVSRECRLRGIASPEWTRSEPLSTWWFPALIDPSLEPLTIARTPPDLACRGIWLDERALETV